MSNYDQSMPDDGRVFGFMLATVLSNNDDKLKGMLKLRLLCEGEENIALEGVKVIAPFAGKAYGVYALPEVGEQVVVGFFEGCIDRPFVLGSVYAVDDDMLPESYHKENALKRFKTKTGTLVEFSDIQDDEAIIIKTPKKLSVEMKEKTQSILITTGETQVMIDGKNGAVKIIGQKQVSLESGSAQLAMKSGGDVEIKGNKIEIKGNAVKLESSGTLDLKGQKSGVAGAIVEVKADGILTLKGAMTKIN